MVSLGAEKARTEQGRKEEKKQAREILPVQGQRKMNREAGMTRGFFDEFPALWDAFEDMLKKEILRWIDERTVDCAKSKNTNISTICRNVAFSYWWIREGAGYQWKTQLDEVFFESRYYDTKRQLCNYDNLATMPAPHLSNEKGKNARDFYADEIKPFLDARKQELMDAFAEMAKELDDPFLYTLYTPVDGHEIGLTLG